MALKMMSGLAANAFTPGATLLVLEDLYKGQFTLPQLFPVHAGHPLLIPRHTAPLEISVPTASPHNRAEIPSGLEKSLNSKPCLVYFSKQDYLF